MSDQHQQPLTSLVKQRFSCRVYAKQPIAVDQQIILQSSLDHLQQGPFGTTARFKLIAATDEDQRALRGLGTYGFIRNSPAFIAGAIQPGKKNLEDYGYLLEAVVLKATDMGLGTCWLGGSFTKSSFAQEIGLTENETMPAVASVGYIDDQVSARHSFIRLRVRAEHRLPWGNLFFREQLGNPLSYSDAGDYAIPLEMVRLAPSASNKQPWRVIKQDGTFHFLLQRTQKYGKGSLLFRSLRLADLQRVDMGIALCHFEMTANSLGLRGRWESSMSTLELPNELTEYTASWHCM